MEYKIYQLDQTCKDYRQKAFASLRMLNSMKLAVNIKDYKEVASAEIDGDTKGIKDVCEVLFRIYNFNHPNGFKGHSMSVSDIIYFPKRNEYYFCDSWEFTKVEL